MKTGNIIQIVLLSICVLVATAPQASAQELEAGFLPPAPCPAGEKLRAEQPDLLSVEDWEFMLAYGCPSLELMAVGVWPGTEVPGGAADSSVDSEGYGEQVGPEEAVREGEDPSIVPFEAGAELACYGEVQERAFDLEAPLPEVGVGAPGTIPEAQAEGDTELVALQADFISMGCAQAVLPAKCQNHPYRRRILEETEEAAWSEAK